MAETESKYDIEKLGTGYKGLAMGIVRRATLDYYNLLKGKNVEGTTIVSLRRFFRSPWFEFLCGLDGEYLMLGIERDAEAWKKKNKKDGRGKRKKDKNS